MKLDESKRVVYLTDGEVAILNRASEIFKEILAFDCCVQVTDPRDGWERWYNRPDLDDIQWALEDFASGKFALGTRRKER